MYTVMSLVFALSATQVSTWTLDAPEVTKYFSNREQTREQIEKVLKSINEVSESTSYAKEYDYNNYKDKKIDEIIINGGEYLDGLSNALFEYKQIMDRCAQTKARPFAQLLDSGGKYENPCAMVMKNGEYIQRLSEVVMWTTSAMRDKSDKNYKDEDETALIARLAWLLDRLAHLTGFESLNNSTETDVEEKAKSPESNAKSLEIMVPIENGRLILPPTPLTARNKRAVHPFDEVTSYYLKYKAWTNSNPEKEIIGETNFEVQNNLRVKPIQRRSTDPKKGLSVRVRDNTHELVFKKPEYVKAKLVLHKIIDVGLKVKDKIKKVKKAVKHKLF